VVTPGSGKVTNTKVYIEPKLIDNRDMSLSTIEVDVMVANVEDLYGWGVWLRFAPLRTILAYYSTSGQDEFLSASGVMVYVPPPKENVAAGTLYIGATRMMAVSGVSGSGKLATLTFNVLEAGECAIEVFGSKLINSNNELIPRNEFSGYYKGPVAELVRKELPQGRDISLAEYNKQVFLSSVKNRGEVPLYTMVKFHMIRDDGKVIDKWTGENFLYVDGFIDDYPKAWKRVGESPYLDAIDDNYIIGQRKFVMQSKFKTYEGDGTNTTFPTYITMDTSKIIDWRIVHNSLTVYVDDVEQDVGVDYTVEVESDGLWSVEAPHSSVTFWYQPYIVFTNPPADGAEIKCTYTYPSEWSSRNHIKYFSFEDYTVPAGRTIEKVEIQTYVDEGNGIDNLWLYLYVPEPYVYETLPYKEPTKGWYTWDVTGILDTIDKINAVKLRMRTYSEYKPVYDEIIVNAARLRIVLDPPVVEPGKVLEMDPVEWAISEADIGDYTCEAIVYYSYHGTKYNPSTETSTFTWWITE